MKRNYRLILILLVPLWLVLIVTNVKVAGQAPLPENIAAIQSQHSITFTVQHDAYIYEAHPDTNYGSANRLYVQHNGNGNDEYSLFQFDLSALPGDAVVISATLDVWVSTQADFPEITYDVSTLAIRDTWTDTTVTWNNKPTAQTVSDPLSAVRGDPHWQSWDVTNAVKVWASSPNGNHGIMLVGDTLTTDAREFYALPEGNAARLYVYYDDPCYAVTGIAITGAFSTTTGISVTLMAAVSPDTATVPITYTWSPAPIAGQGTADAHYLWDVAGQHIITVTTANCGGTAVATHTVTVNAVDLLDIPSDIHRRAAQHLEESRGFISEWSNAQLGSPVRPLYRPDIDGVAYYEFPVLTPAGGRVTVATADQPAGFIIVSTGEHDYPIAHWASGGKPPTQKLEESATAIGEKAVKFYKLDSLAYAAENENGERVATLGEQPFKITGMDPDWVDNPPAPTHAEWTPAIAMTDDSHAGTITGTFVISGPAVPTSLQLSGWNSWDEMKAGYSDSYGVFSEMLRRHAAEAWTAESAMHQYGQPLHKGQTYLEPLLWFTPTVSLSGAGASFVQTTLNSRSKLPPELAITVLDSTLGEAVPFTATINYENGISETVRFIIIEPYQVYLPLITRDADSMTSAGRQFPLRTQSVDRVESGWHYYTAGTDADQCWYSQIPAGVSPNTTTCPSGCGATAWSMQFGWIDNQAADTSTNNYWLGRWGLYRLNGGGADKSDVVAPKIGNDSGVNNMTWEIHGDIDTWCTMGAAPTPPWDMAQVRNYVDGHSDVKISVDYSNVGYGWDSIMELARDTIAYADDGKETPVVIGIGLLSHYPLAYGYRWQDHTYCVIPSIGWGCATFTTRQFLVNEGWAQGYGEWVASDIWYAGVASPRSAWNDDVGLYRPSDGKWYFDYDHNGTSDGSALAWGGSDRLPLAGDFNRDGVLGDIAVFRPSTTQWVFNYHHDTTNDLFTNWGYSDGKPFALDSDRDGFVDDVGLYRTSDHMWWFTDHTKNFANGSSGPWGWDDAQPVAGDFDRDGYADDVALFRSSTFWSYDYNHNGNTDATSGTWGLAGDLPFAGDFDKDGYLDDVGVYRSSTGMWYYDYNHNGTTDATSGAWGWGGCWLPIAGNFETK